MTFTGKFTATVLGVCLALGAAIGANAQDDPFKNQIKARKAHMQLRAFYLGQLGAMAKGEVEYDAEAATSAANSLAALGTLEQSSMWPQGSDNTASKDTRALPDIWRKYDDLVKIAKANGEAVAAMQAVAGTDLAALQGQMKALGDTCGACHKAYRQSNN